MAKAGNTSLIHWSADPISGEPTEANHLTFNDLCVLNCTTNWNPKTSTIFEVESAKLITWAKRRTADSLYLSYESIGKDAECRKESEEAKEVNQAEHSTWETICYVSVGGS